MSAYVSNLSVPLLLALQTFRGAGGLICPAHATLAERAGCSVSTVQRALAMADGGGERKQKESGWEEMRRAAAGLPDLLARRREAIEARLASRA
jgi:hypothetical protein